MFFNRSFVFLFRKFNTVSSDVFYSLFHSYCLSFNGIELWIKLKSAGNFKAMSISYHAAIIKRMLGLPKRFSNHFACNFLGILTFEHFLGNIYFRYLSWPFKCNSLCFNPFKLYFIRHSTYAQYIYDRFLTKYDVSDLLRQDKDSVLARLFFIQHRELSSFYGLLWMIDVKYLYFYFLNENVYIYLEMYSQYICQPSLMK